MQRNVTIRDAAGQPDVGALEQIEQQMFCLECPLIPRTYPESRTDFRYLASPLEVSRDDISSTVDTFRFFAGAARAITSQAAADYTENHLSVIIREPLGVVGVVTPWNDPLLMAAWKIAPILAAGNALVIKPSELTPLSMMNFAELVADLMPAGVLNVVTGIGPVVVSEAHFDRVVGYLERAKKAGVRAVLGRSPLPGPGFFVAPTVLVDVTEDHEVSREEIFGPVVTVETFTDEAEAVRRANGVPYGLSASVWTENARRSHHVASQLRAGTVSVNSHLILATEAPWAASRAPATDATCQSTH